MTTPNPYPSPYASPFAPPAASGTGIAAPPTPSQATRQNAGPSGQNIWNTSTQDVQNAQSGWATKGGNALLNNISAQFQGYGDPRSNAGLWTDAYDAQNNYQQMGNQALQQRGAQVQNPYGAVDPGRSQLALSDLNRFANTGIQGDFAGAQQQFYQQGAQAQAANLAAARSATGGSLAAAGAMRNAALQNAQSGQQLASLWGQQQIQNQEAAGQAQANAYGNNAEIAQQLQNQNQQTAYQQAGLQQQQQGLNQSTYNQLYGMGQTAQNASLQAYLGGKGLQLNNAMFQAGQNANMVAGGIGMLSSLGSYGAQQMGNNNNNNQQSDPYAYGTGGAGGGYGF